MAVVCAVSVAEMLRCSGLMRSDSSASGSPRASSSEAWSPSPSPSRSTMERCAAAAWAEASPSSVMSEARTPGRVSTACMVSSRRQTQSWTSWSGRLQSSAKRATLPGTKQQGGRLGPGQRQGVLPEGAPGQVPGRRAELHAEEDRAEREGELPEQPAETAGDVGVELAQVHGRRHGRRALLLRLHHRLEDGPVGLEDAEAPLSRARRPRRRRRRHRRRARSRWLPTTCSSATRASSSKAMRTSGSGFSSSPPSVATPKARVRAASNQLSPAPGPRADDLHQVAEEAPHRVVGVAGTEHAHPRMLGGRAQGDVHDLGAGGLLRPRA